MVEKTKRKSIYSKIAFPLYYKFDYRKIIAEALLPQRTNILHLQAAIALYYQRKGFGLLIGTSEI